MTFLACCLGILAAAEGAGLISLLIWLVIIAVVIWLVFLVIGMLPLPEPIKTIITVVIALVLLLVVIQRLGFL